MFVISFVLTFVFKTSATDDDYEEIGFNLTMTTIAVTRSPDAIGTL